MKQLSEFFEQETAGILQEFRADKISIHKVYEWWDCCLIDDMLSEEGNAFAMHYFDFDSGRYIYDYIEALQGPLPSELHVKYTENNYQRMRQVIDRRYDEWKAPKK